jgi:cytochrome c oxidase subunit IV
MQHLKVNQSILKIIGLIGEYDKKNIKSTIQGFLSSGYREDCYPIEKNENQINEDKKTTKFIKDFYYPDFRRLMFLKDESKITQINHRFVKDCSIKISIAYKEKENNYIPIEIIQSEVFLFHEQVSLFSISVKVDLEEVTLGDVNNLMSVIRNFDTTVKGESAWHEFISKHFLCNLPLRGDHVKVDEYSGSKFKLYSAIDCDPLESPKSNLLFDLATTSPLGSGSGSGNFAPSEDYYNHLMQNKVSIFNNWEALCLNDGFCCFGTDLLWSNQELNKNKYATWDYTYFRIYLFRLFLKYNIYKYNQDIQDSDNLVKLRDKFENFLQTYNISHISYNFLPNELYHKIGIGLDIEAELTTFRERINNISQKIEEKQQAKTNLLLQVVAGLSGLSSLSPIIDFLSHLQTVLGWSNIVFYTTVTFTALLLLILVIYFLYPEKLIKWLRLKKTK